MSKHLSRFAICVVVALQAHSAIGAEQVRASVADLAWMTGSWAGPFGEQMLEENWIKPIGGTIACVVRFTGGGATSMMELIIIEESEGSLVLRVRQWFPGYVPRAPEPQTMALGEIGERRVSFKASGDGDFKTLGYSRPSADAFNIDVETTEGEKFRLSLKAQP
ncbi:MAG: DUF6265 family protein [Gammaproteobacteria bacterium]|nr:DUF6265 family protein [Gammaproteobacteria bacterium]